MAKRENFTTGEGTARYPYLTKPDTGEGRNFTCEPTYKVDLILPQEGNGELLEMLDERAEKAYQDAVEKQKTAALKKKVVKADPYELEEDDNGDETGNVILKFKMKAHVEPAKGDPFDQSPSLFDTNGPFTGDSIWGGSKIKVNFQVIPYFVASSKQAGLSLRLRAVQVIELVSANGGDASAYGFEVAPKESFEDVQESDDSAEDDF